jgi:hypothetical protein
MSAGPEGGRPPTEEELRAAYEEQIKKLRVEDVVLQTIVSLLNLGARKAGLAPGTDDERDAEQLRIAVEGVRGLLPLIEDGLREEGAPIRSALSQLQMAYATLAGAGPGAAAPPAEGGPEAHGSATEGAGAAGQARDDRSEPGPAQRSGRLWIPGQGGGPPPRRQP